MNRELADELFPLATTSRDPIVFRRPTEEEEAEWAAQLRTDRAVWAWDRWAEYSCQERGGHRWQLEVEDGVARVRCPICNGEPFPDHTELLNLEPIPVEVHVESHRDYWGEYDLDFQVWPVGGEE